MFLLPLRIMGASNSQVALLAFATMFSESLAHPKSRDYGNLEGTLHQLIIHTLAHDHGRTLVNVQLCRTEALHFY